MDAVLEVRDVVTRFGAQTVHRGVSFDIARGEVVALIGGSGAGKSVLLKVILGLLRPETGTARVLGVDMWGSRPEAVRAVRNRCGVLFQNGALFSALTVGENVATPLKEHMHLPRSIEDYLVALRLAMSGLEPSVAAKMPSDLSGGMRKRAALARALALEPELLFLDEPTSGLDPINARGFDQLVQTLSSGLGLTVLMVTHDLDTLYGIVDRIIVLGDGRVLANGTLDEVRHTPDRWIQEYFGARVAEVR